MHIQEYSQIKMVLFLRSYLTLTDEPQPMFFLKSQYLWLRAWYAGVPILVDQLLPRLPYWDTVHLKCKKW